MQLINKNSYIYHKELLQRHHQVYVIESMQFSFLFLNQTGKSIYHSFFLLSLSLLPPLLPFLFLIHVFNWAYFTFSKCIVVDIFFFLKKKKKNCICLLDARLEMEPPAKIAMLNFKKYMTTVKYKRVKAQTS